MPSRHLLLSGLLLAFIYIAWAVPFMLESSVVAVDGQRYFGLFDDAMISMRYAWNLAHGNGLVWNPGERVEGFTNPLWVADAGGWEARATVDAFETFVRFCAREYGHEVDWWCTVNEPEE